MTNKTIPELTSVSLLNAADLLPVWQGATTKKVEIGLLPNPSYKHAVFLKDSDYFVQDGSNGAIVYSNSDARNAVQWALDNLTAARDWKETIVIYGDIQVSSSLTVPSYTIVRVIGSLEVTDTNSLFSSTNASNIEFIGGNYILPSAGTSAVQKGINLSNVNNAVIRDLAISGGGNHGINLENNTSHIKIMGCDIGNSGDDPISVIGSNNVQILGNTCHDGRSASGGSSGIEIEDNSYQVLVHGNVCYGQQRGIQTVVDGGEAFDGNYGISIIGNICYGNSAAGIICQYNGTTGVESRIHTIKGNDCQDNGVGISINNCNDSIISGNVIEDTSEVNGAGIVAIGSDRLTISSNVVKDCKGNGISTSGDYLQIYGNQISNCGKDGNSGHVYGIKMNASHNYVRCHDNELSDNQGTPTMSGINTNSGNGVEIYYNHFSNLANNVGPGVNAVYEQSATGPIKIFENTNDTGDSVTFLTEAEGQVTNISPITVAHGMVGAADSDAIVQVTPMDSGVTDFSAALDATNLTITFNGGGSKKFSYSIKSKRV